VEIKRLTPAELLALHARVSEELRERKIVRSANNPTGDLAEYLFCEAYGWERAQPSHPHADATADNGEKLIQIKGRRWTQHNKSRILGALRGLPDEGFHILAAVLFSSDYSVKRAILIPHALVLKGARFIQRTNSWRFVLSDAAWSWPGVEDATERLKAVALT